MDGTPTRIAVVNDHAEFLAMVERVLGWGRSQGRTWHADADVGRPVVLHGGRHVCAVMTSDGFGLLRETLDAREAAVRAQVDGVASDVQTEVLDDIARVRFELAL